MEHIACWQPRETEVAAQPYDRHNDAVDIVLSLDRAAHLAQGTYNRMTRSESTASERQGMDRITHALIYTSILLETTI